MKMNQVVAMTLTAIMIVVIMFISVAGVTIKVVVNRSEMMVVTVGILVAMMIIMMRSEAMMVI